MSAPKRILAVKEEVGRATETEVLARVLDQILFQREARAGLAAMAGCGGFVNYFDS